MSQFAFFVSSACIGSHTIACFPTPLGHTHTHAHTRTRTHTLQDAAKTGMVSSTVWAEVMQDVIGLVMDWDRVMHKVVPAEAVDQATGGIDYNLFLTDPSVMTRFSELDEAPVS